MVVSRNPKAKKRTPPVGLEPTIFGLEVQRVIHYAMRAACGGALLAEEFQIVDFLLGSRKKDMSHTGLEPVTFGT
jgi:hypothetical protein